jgi:hypothetical protein
MFNHLELQKRRGKQKNVRTVPVRNMKAYRRVKSINEFILNLTARCVRSYPSIWLSSISKKIGRVRITYVRNAFVQKWLSLKSNKHCIFWMCVCSLSYPAFKAYALYYTAICGLSGSSIYFHLSHKTHDFPKKKIQMSIKCVFSISRKFFPKYFSFQK